MTCVKYLGCVRRKSLVGSQKVKFASSLFEHSNTWKAASGSHQRLFHAGRVDHCSSVENSGVEKSDGACDHWGRNACAGKLSATFFQVAASYSRAVGYDVRL